MSDVPAKATARPQVLVSAPEALAACLEVVARSPRIALDTESNGFHAYVERVCLVQVGTEEQDWALDPLAVDVRPLWPLLAGKDREVVLHAAEYDVLCLKREYNARLGRIFDTHAAAKALGLQRVGLGNLLADELDVHLVEDEQKSDWGKRPLSAKQLTYAYNDVRYLLTLRDKLGHQLSERKLSAEADAEFERLRMKEPRARPFDPEGWQKMKAARTFDGKGRAVLRALYLLRDARAKELDRPPFKVLSDLFLAEVARRLPKSADQLVSIPGASSVQIKRLEKELLAAVQEGLNGPPPPKPQPGAGRSGPPWRRGPQQQDPVVEERFERLRAWRKQRAEARKVEVQVIAPNAVLLAIAKAAPDNLDKLAAVDGMDAFRLEQYGAELLGAANAPPRKKSEPVEPAAMEKADFVASVIAESAPAKAEPEKPEAPRPPQQIKLF